jgi:hypothetical protein
MIIERRAGFSERESKSAVHTVEKLEHSVQVSRRVQ